MTRPEVLSETTRVTQLLRKRGIDVGSLGELVETRVPREAVPVLVMALPTANTPEVRRTIVRCLTDTAARGLAAQPLVRELFRAQAEGDEFTAWLVGNALAQVGDDSVSAQILVALQDRRLGSARETLAEALGRAKKRPEVVSALLELLEEGEVTGHAIRALGKLGAWEAAERIAPFLSNGASWVRREAAKALERMEKARAREARDRVRLEEDGGS